MIPLINPLNHLPLQKNGEAYVDKDGNHFPLINLVKVPTLKNYMKEGNYDIVHSHLYESNIVTRLSVPEKTILFNSIHAISSQANYNQSKASLWLEKLTYKKKHRLIHVSQTVREDFEHHVGTKDNAVVLYNYIEDVFFSLHPKPNLTFRNLKWWQWVIYGIKKIIPI